MLCQLCLNLVPRSLQDDQVLRLQNTSLLLQSHHSAWRGGRENDGYTLICEVIFQAIKDERTMEKQYHSNPTLSVQLANYWIAHFLHVISLHYMHTLASTIEKTGHGNSASQ